jgi:hypothetical protein
MDPMPAPRDGTKQGDGRLHAWTEWYRFARDQLGLDHGERVEYANLRYVEEQNREVLRRHGTTRRTTRRDSALPRPRFHP